MSDKSSTGWRILRSAAGLLLFAAVVWFAGPSALLEALRQTNLWWTLMALLAYGTSIGLKIIRWRLLVERLGTVLAVREAARAYGLGMLLAAVTPGRVGQHIKSVTVVRRGASWDRAVAGTFLDQLLDVLVMVAILPFSLIYFGRLFRGSLAVGGALVALGLLAALLLHRWVGTRVRRALDTAKEMGRVLPGVPLVQSLASAGLFFASLSLLGGAVSLGVDWYVLALATVASSVLEIVPVTVAGLGVREASLVALLRPLAVDPARILAVTLLMRTFHLVAGAVLYLLGGGQQEPRAEGPAQA